MTVSRRVAQREALLGDVLTEARKQIDDGGPASLNWRGIARAVGVGASTLYTYFDGVDGLYTAVITDAYDTLAGFVAGAVDESEPASQRLEAAAWAYRRWAIDNPARFNLIFTDALQGYEAPAEGPTVGAQAGALASFTTAISDAVGEDSPDIERWSRRRQRRALGFWSAIHGHVMLEINHHLEWFEHNDEVFRELLDVHLTGLENW